MNVKSNIRSAFISLIDRSFPASHKLRKIFNRNTLKLSYSCMPNVKQLIDGHNKALLKNAETAQPRQDEENKMQLWKKKTILMGNAWWIGSVQVTVKTQDTNETYIGLIGKPV